MCLCLSAFVALCNCCKSQLGPEHVWAQYRQILGKYTPQCTERKCGARIGGGDTTVPDSSMCSVKPASCFLGLESRR